MRDVLHHSYQEESVHSSHTNRPSPSLSISQGLNTDRHQALPHFYRQLPLLNYILLCRMLHSCVFVMRSLLSRPLDQHEPGSSPAVDAHQSFHLPNPKCSCQAIKRQNASDFASLSRLYQFPPTCIQNANACASQTVFASLLHSCSRLPSHLINVHAAGCGKL